GRFGIDSKRLQEVGGQHLDDLGVVRAVGLLKVAGYRQVPTTTLPFRKGLVRDPSDQILEEPVLPSIGRSIVGLNEQDLVSNQACEQRFQGGPRPAAEGRESVLRERLAENRTGLDQRPLLG